GKQAEAEGLAGANATSKRFDKGIPVSHPQETFEEDSQMRRYLPAVAIPSAPFLLSFTRSVDARDHAYFAPPVLDFVHDQLEASGCAFFSLPLASQPGDLFTLAGQFDSFPLHRVVLFGNSLG